MYHHPNGDKYIGEWKDDKFEGNGIYLFKNGERYEGELIKGRKKGQGKYYYTNGNTYTGAWNDNKKSGYGVYIYKRTFHQTVFNLTDSFRGEVWGAMAKRRKRW